MSTPIKKIPLSHIEGLPTIVNHEDTDTVTLTGTGTVDNPLKAEVTSPAGVDTIDDVLLRTESVSKSNLYFEKDALPTTGIDWILGVTSPINATTFSQFGIGQLPSGYLIIDAGVGISYGGVYYNSYYGSYALQSLPSATAITNRANSAYGKYALNKLTAGFGNVGTGENAGRYLTTGSNNTFYGYNAGREIKEGSGNIIIGNFMFANSAEIDNTLVNDTTIIGTTTRISFKVSPSGLTTIPQQTNAAIESDGTGKAVITKEYFEENVKTMVVENPTVELLSLSALNSTYPDAPIGFQVVYANLAHSDNTLNIQGGTTTVDCYAQGLTYVKISSTNWSVMALYSVESAS